MIGPLAFITMHGLLAGVVGLALGVPGALALLAGLATLAAARRRRRDLLPLGAAATTTGLLLALAGAGLMLFADIWGLGEQADAVSFPLAAFAVPAAGLAGWLASRAARAASSRGAASSGRAWR